MGIQLFSPKFEVEECLEEILRLVREVLELGMTKMELTLEIEKMQV